MVNINQISVGDVFSESSHYILKEVTLKECKLLHLESKEEVVLDHLYVQNLLSTADQFDKEVKVTKEDKKDEAKTPGIRTIWENIHTTQVFTVCFRKQDTPYSKKKLKELQEAQISKYLKEVEEVQKSKKGVLDAAKKALAEVQANPILPFEKGEQRVLRGYKIQFESNDGKYNVIDMDITEENKQRQVNINTIEWLVFNGTKYIVN